MATTKKSTTKKTTSAAKKAPAKKTTTKKVTKKTVKAEETKKSNVRKNTEDAEMRIRFFVIFIGILIAGSFFLPIGEMYGDTQNGSIVIEKIISGDYAEMSKYIFALLVPVLFCEISVIMMLIKSDRFTAILSVMITGIAICAQLIFNDFLGTLEIGWYAILCGSIIEFVYSIILLVTLPSMKNQIK